VTDFTTAFTSLAVMQRFRRYRSNSGIRGFVADEVDPDTYQQITCIICQQVHFVNPVTGKVLGVDDE
jgi:hypothetical protein